MGRLTGAGVGAGVGVAAGVETNAVSVTPAEESVPVKGGRVLVVVGAGAWGKLCVPPNPYRLRGVLVGFSSGVHAATMAAPRIPVIKTGKRCFMG